MAISIISSNSNSLSAYTLRKTQQTQSQSVGRITSGTNSTPGSPGVSSDSVALRLKNSAANDAKTLANVGNALSFLDAQATSLRQISSIISAMSEAVSKMQDATKKSSDLANHMQDFNALRQQLVLERNATYGGQSLHNTTGDSNQQPLNVSLDASGSRTVSLTQSNFLANGGTSWDELVGITTSNVELSASEAAEAEAAEASKGNTDEYSDTLGGLTNSGAGNGKNNNSASGDVSSSAGLGTTNYTDTAENLLKSGWVSSTFTQLLEGTASMLAENGSLQTALSLAVDSITNRAQGSSDFYSKITESDVAQEVASLAKAELSTKSTSSAMTQTNLTAEGVLKALWGEPASGIEWYQPPKMTTNFESIAFKVPSASASL